MNKHVTITLTVSPLLYHTMAQIAVAMNTTLEAIAVETLTDSVLRIRDYHPASVTIRDLSGTTHD